MAITRLITLVVDLFDTNAFNATMKFRVSPHIFSPLTRMELSLFLYLSRWDEFLVNLNRLKCFDALIFLPSINQLTKLIEGFFPQTHEGAAGILAWSGDYLWFLCGRIFENPRDWRTKLRCRIYTRKEIGGFLQRATHYLESPRDHGLWSHTPLLFR